MFRHALTAAALAMTLVSPAFAQTGEAPKPPASAPETKFAPLPSGIGSETAPDQSKSVQHTGFVEAQHATDWRGSRLIGATVYGPDNASIGNINEVLIGNDGKVRAAVIGVGGFLGVGEKNVAVTLDTLNITRKPESSSIDKVTVSYSKDDLKNAPTFAYYEPDKSPTTGSNASEKLQSLNPINKAKN